MFCLCNLYCNVYKSLRAPQYIPSLELVFPPDHYLRLVLCPGSLSPFRVFAVEPPRSSVCLPLVIPASLQASVVPSCVYSVVWLVADIFTLKHNFTQPTNIPKFLYNWESGVFERAEQIVRTQSLRRG